MQTFFHSFGIFPDFQMMRKVLEITVRRKRHRLKQMIEIWPKGQGLPDAFILHMTLVTFS